MGIDHLLQVKTSYLLLTTSFLLDAQDCARLLFDCLLPEAGQTTPLCPHLLPSARLQHDTNRWQFYNKHWALEDTL